MTPVQWKVQIPLNMVAEMKAGNIAIKTIYNIWFFNNANDNVLFLKGNILHTLC